VTIYEMSDFQCPWCGRFALEVLPALEREYVATGRVRLIFVHLPLPNHANAVPAAELAMCAARQNRFWRVHDLLFRTQEQWSSLREPGAFFLTLADSAGADRDSLVACLRSRTMRPLIESDARGAMRTGVRSTPSFYIEGGLLSGFVPFEVFRPILDSIIRARTSRR
jgi:protein-disulfide isomerase